MVNSLENIDKSKVSADRITGLDQKIQEELSTAVTGAASTIITSDLTANKILVSNSNGKVAASAKALTDKQDKLVSGTNIKTINNTSILGSGNISISTTPSIDSKSITTNSSSQLQTVGVIDNNNTSNAIKTWTGTQAQYNALKATPSWYAWVSDGTTYFTQSATPSVGDTVYDSNKTATSYTVSSVSGSTIEIV